MKTQSKLIATLLSAFLLAGCISTTPEQAAAKTLSTIAITADESMTGWAKWVVFKKSNPATDQAELLRQEGRVKNAYELYQTSMKLASFAWNMYATTSNKNPADLQDALNKASLAQKALTTTITTITKP